jgi:hypothetical protein
MIASSLIKRLKMRFLPLFKWTLEENSKIKHFFLMTDFVCAFFLNRHGDDGQKTVFEDSSP